MNSSVSSTSTFCQLAAVEAFTAESALSVQRMVEEFRKRTGRIRGWAERYSRNSLPAAAWRVLSVPNISALGRSSREIADRLLNKRSCRSTGTAFGKYGEGYLRFSFANSLTNIEVALDRIRTFASRL